MNRPYLIWRLIGLLSLMELLTFAPSAWAQSTAYTYDAPGRLTSITSASPTLPTIVAQPITVVTAEDGNAHFSVSASGPGPLSYQWLSNGVAISGAIGDVLIISNIVVPQNLITNGGFESPLIVATYQTLPVGGSLPGWNVESGTVDVVYTYMFPAAGRQCLDLNGTSLGAIYQDVPTEPGHQYILSYSLAGNPVSAPDVKTNTVSWDGAVVDTNRFDTTTTTITAMGWTNKEYLLSATGPLTRVRFQSLVSGAYGPALDQVSLLEVQPAPVEYRAVVSNPSGSVTSIVATIEYDLDHDSLPDSWERTYFGNTGILADSDNDGDGVSNGDEYREGTDPTNAANFRSRLDLIIRPGGFVSRSPFRSSYALNDVVQLTATPDPGNFFFSWTGSIVDFNPTLNVVMDGHKTITALFGIGLINGDYRAGTILAGATNTYGFAGNAGESIILRVAEYLDGGGFDPRIQLFSPTGVSLASVSGFTASEIALTLTNSGAFMVVVSDGTANGLNGTGDYQLQFLKTPGAFIVPADDEGGALASGAQGLGTIRSGDLDAWTFTASLGDSIVVRIAERTDHGDFDPWIRLYGPDGKLLGSANGFTAAEIALTATNSGTFTVVAADAGASSPFFISDTGTYQLRLAKLPGPFVVPPLEQGGDLISGTNAAGVIQAGDLDLWRFTADVGDSFIVRVAQTSDNNGDFDPWIRLYGPDGKLLGSAIGLTANEIALTATNSGTFNVVVADAGASSPFYLSDTGNYQLRLAKFPGPFIVPAQDEGGDLINGANHSGVIETGDLDLWRFTANKGDSIIVRIAQTTDDNGDFDPSIRLYGPNGKLLETASGFTAAEIAVTATNNGTFSVVASDTGASSPFYISDTGSYALRLAKAPGPFVVADEGAVRAQAGVYFGTNDAGDLDLWGFWANKGNLITVLVEQLSDDNGDYDPGIRLYSPSGLLLNSLGAATMAQFSRLATNSGLYLLVVGDAGASSPFYLSDTGTYRLTLGGITGPVEFTNWNRANDQLIMGGSVGPTNVQYVLIGSVSLMTPGPLWTPVATNFFDSLGRFTITNQLSPGAPSQFFQLRYP